ncbi:hypothetical protein GYMLUDRAFT_65725 [Collybiopsis luxurians FD-317 M1]|nr:hypothetical protein GYMLUDRAFT_65725 [Collybiopsis luxurians FD-317 M1]
MSDLDIAHTATRKCPQNSNSFPERVSRVRSYSVDFDANGLSKQVNAVQKKFAKEPADNLIAKKKVPDAQVEAKRKGTKDFEALMRKKASGIGNIMPHHEVLLGLDAMDLNRGAKVAGHRGYYLTNEGIELNQALILYASILRKKGYKKIQPPPQLDQFDKELYKVCHSTCFRKEVGSAGCDMRGIFCIHQFEKVEQFIVDDFEKSWEVLSKPWVEISSSEYRGAMRYDLEAWFPFQKGYKELGSCSNFMDYHARWLEVRCSLKTKDQASKLYYHMLNGTLVAMERALCCLVENYQTPDVRCHIPQSSSAYIQGRTF